MLDFNKPQTPTVESEEEKNKEREGRRMEIISLTKEIAERGEIFPFSGIDLKARTSLEADEAEYPGFTTPIGTILEAMKEHGMKVVLGKHPESGNVFILPANSDDIESDMVFAKFFLVSETKDTRLKKLISLDIERAKDSGK